MHFLCVQFITADDVVVAVCLHFGVALHVSEVHCMMSAWWCEVYALVIVSSYVYLHCLRKQLQLNTCRANTTCAGVPRTNCFIKTINN